MGTELPPLEAPKQAGGVPFPELTLLGVGGWRAALPNLRLDDKMKWAAMRLLCLAGPRGQPILLSSAK